MYEIISEYVFILFRRTNILVFLLVSLFALLPVKAFSTDCNVSGDIHFLITNQTGQDFCIICDGPYFRSTDAVFIDAGVTNCQFYAADFTLFSPLGAWSCELRPPDPSGGCRPGVFSKKSFCLGNTENPFTNSSVHLLALNRNDQPDFDVNVENSGPPCRTSVASNLGDNPDTSGQDRDIDEYFLNAEAGQEVTLTLRGNPHKGHNGGIVRLRLSGNSLNEFAEGALPLDMNLILPEAGRYSIRIIEPNMPEGEGLRGSYVLSVTSPDTDTGLIEPAENVE